MGHDHSRADPIEQHRPALAPCGVRQHGGGIAVALHRYIRATLRRDKLIEIVRAHFARARPLIVEMLESCRFDVINRLLIEQNYVSFAIGEEALRYCAMPKFHDDAWNHLLCPAETIGLVLDVCRTLGLGIEFR